MVEKCHVKAKHQCRKENHDDILNNIIDLCPRCHYYFDKGGITIHNIWKCFIFSDKKYFISDSNEKIENPFYKFEYSYPHKLFRKKVSRLNPAYINWNQENEFETTKPLTRFWEELNFKIKCEKWDEELDEPIKRTLTSNLSLKYDT